MNMSRLIVANCPAALRSESEVRAARIPPLYKIFVAGENESLQWNLNGSTAESNSATASQCPQPSINSNQLKFLHSPYYVLPNSPGSVVAQVETYNATSQVAFFVDGGTTPIIVNASSAA